MGLGRRWECGGFLLANEVAGTCPECRLAWPVLPPSPSSLALGQLRAGGRPHALGFRLCAERGTSQILHRMKYGGRADPGKRLGRWMAAACPPASRDDFGSCAFALAPANSARVQSVGIVGARLGFRVGASYGDFHAGQGSPSAFLDRIVSGGTNARVGGILRGQFHHRSEKGGVGR